MSTEKWMRGAFSKHKGALHRYLGVPEDEKIPAHLLNRARTHLKRLIKKYTGRKREGYVKQLRRVNAAVTARKVYKRRAKQYGTRAR